MRYYVNHMKKFGKKLTKSRVSQIMTPNFEVSREVGTFTFWKKIKIGSMALIENFSCGISSWELI